MTRALKIAGVTIVIVACVFLARELSENWTTIRAWRPEPGELALLGALSVVYGSAQFLLAEAWHRIVTLHGKETRRRTHFSFTVSIVARYVPGNVAHLVGRAFYLRGGGLSDGALFRATLTELATTPAGAIVTLALLAPFLPASVLGPWPETLRWALLLTPVALCLLLAILQPLTRCALAPGKIGPPVLLAAAFMAVLGGVFAEIAWLIAGIPALPAAAAGLTAWLLGYATPGAPGGLGIRESALLLLLHPFASEADLLLAASAFRVVTTFGELACFGAGWMIYRR